MSRPDGLDLVSLRGISAHGHHGVFDHERRDGQVFIADVDLGIDLTAAAEHDDLAATVDYGVVAQQVHDVLSGDPASLLETVALRIVNVCLRHDPVRWVKVTVHKPSAPIEVAFDDVAVAIERRRQ